jgi:hypothetical protein
MIEWIVLGSGAVWLWAKSSSSSTQQLDDSSQTIVTQYSTGVRSFAQAIARAEGFGIVGSLPTTANNPGSLTDPTGSIFGLPTLGTESLVQFPTPASGWDALYRQLQLIADGQSAVYTIDLTIAQMAQRYAPNDPTTWAGNVAAFAGYTPDTPLSMVLT